MMRRMTGNRIHLWLWFLILAWVLPGCEGTVDPDPTDSELIRRLLYTGGDESILFSTEILGDQTGTQAFARTIDSVRRGFVPTRDFFVDSSEFPSPRQAWEGLVLDTLYGSIRYRIGSNQVSRPFVGLFVGGTAKFEKTQLGSENPWQIWKMQYRKGEQLAGDNTPRFQSLVVRSDSAQKEIITAEKVRIFRDTVLTLQAGEPSNLTVEAKMSTGTDSLFVTYPVPGGYETRVMTHSTSDSLMHSVKVQTLSTSRYGLVAIQAFKSQAFIDSGYPEATATAIHLAIVRFR